MDLVQWVVGLRDGGLLTAIGPRDAERIPLPGDGAPNEESRWAVASDLLLQTTALPLNLLWAQLEGDPVATEEEKSLELDTGGEGPAREVWGLNLVLKTDGDGAASPAWGKNTNSIAAMSLISEFCLAAANILEGAALRPLSLAPTGGAGGLRLTVIPSTLQSDAELGGGLVLVRAGLESLAHARGLVIDDARVHLEGGSVLDWNGAVAHGLVQTRAGQGGSN
jgi:hypothetical protein